MELAKPHVDVGLFTNERDPQLAFWQKDVGLPFDHALPTGGGVLQHRHDMHGSVLKLNHARDPLAPEAPSGYRVLHVARPGLSAPQPLRDPDGNRVVLVPPGTGGVVGIGVELAVRDPDAFHRFYGAGLGLERADGDAYRAGDSLLRFAAEPSAARCGALAGLGFRYLTLQVRAVDRVHEAVLAAGGEEGIAPRTLGDVARISFVRDPDGNWIELSQRGSLVGSVEPV